MNNDLNQYHKILFLELRPWLNENIPETKFKALLPELPKEHFTQLPLFEVEFIKPLTAKRKYYHILIENEAIRYLNNFQILISEALNETEKKYWVYTTLTKVLSQKLKETANVISERNYTIDLNNALGINVQDEVFIINFLKVQLIRIYLEIQSAFPDLLKEDGLTEEEVYHTILNETIPEKSFIKKLQLVDKSTYKEIVASSNFTALKNDNRPPKRGILSYDVIIKHPSRFASFEEQLFQKGYINDHYDFSDKHGQKQELAAIYHQLIKKGYFNPRTYNPTKEIKLLDIRKFLDNRYNTDRDKEFRNYKNSPEKLAKYIESQHWLEVLPLC